MWERRWVPRDPVQLADEVEFYAKTYGATHFPFQDLTASLQRRWTIDFAKEIIKRKLDIDWQLAVGTRCEIMDDEVCQLLYESGCRTLYFAPESGSDRTRKIIKKRMNLDTLMKAVECTVRAKISLGIFLVIGFPEDRREDLEDTVKMVRKLAKMGVEDVSVPVFYPIPASELYNNLRESGRIDDSDEMLMAPLNAHMPLVADERNYCENLSSAQLSFYKYWIVANFYGTAYATHPNKLLRMAKNLTSGREESKMEAFVFEMKKKLLGSGTSNARTETKPRGISNGPRTVPKAPPRSAPSSGEVVTVRRAVTAPGAADLTSG
jgi:radical SAM superfamily enzyme YgiQ (UPF0313 family)